MKTAISIPNPVFLAAEQLGQQMGLSRSELYTHAIRSYLQTHRYSHVTELLNAVYESEAAGIDPVIQQLQHNSLSQDEKW
jgi:hypothetical protein